MAASLYVTPAFAECAPRDYVIAELAKQYNETSRYQARRETGDIVTVFVAADNATLTVVREAPAIPNFMCLATAGKDWREVPTGFEYTDLQGSDAAFMVGPGGDWIFIVNGQAVTRGTDWRRVAPSAKVGLAI